MLSLLSTLGGLLISGLPKLLEYFQNKADQKHELQLAKIQTERELQLAAAGFAAQARVEEIRTEQVAMQTQAQMAVAEAEMVQGAQDHDKAVLAKASTWVSNYVGTVRPTITYIFVIELVLINTFLCYYLWQNPGLITSMDDVIRYTDIIFSADEMAMLGGIIGFWFGSRGWSKK
jgi:multidrug efflux pump subunit AcrA (membrane-fusion protein)